MKELHLLEDILLTKESKKRNKERKKEKKPSTWQDSNHDHIIDRLRGMCSTTVLQPIKNSFCWLNKNSQSENKKEKKTRLIIQCYQERFTAVGRGHFDVDVGLAGDEPVDVALQLLQRCGSA